jgi:hypothetical protein
MMYSAVGLAVAGAAVGSAFRWKVLLPIIILLPLAAIIFSVPRGLTSGETAVVILGAEAILQVGYFAGLLIRFTVTAAMRSASAILKSRGAPTAENDQHNAPAGGAGKGT